MGFLSCVKNFIGEEFEFYKMKKEMRDWEKYPTGNELAWKYNDGSETTQLKPGTWLNYIGDNKNAHWNVMEWDECPCRQTALY